MSRREPKIQEGIRRDMRRAEMIREKDHNTREETNSTSIKIATTKITSRRTRSILIN